MQSFPPKRTKRDFNSHARFARAVRARVKATHGELLCEKCGATNVPLEAHHLAARVDDPRLGVLLCAPCHLAAGAAQNGKRIDPAAEPRRKRR
jgi:5-methylcytosine-specific restriction endonuclease McrA